MNSTFQNSAQVLSVGIFFTLIILGLAQALPPSLVAGLTAHGVPAHTADTIAHLPPVATLFAAFLGYNPATHLLGPHVLAHLTPDRARHGDRRAILPEPHGRRLPRRIARRPQLRDRRLPHRCGRLVDPGRKGAGGVRCTGSRRARARAGMRPQGTANPTTGAIRDNEPVEPSKAASP